MFYSFLLDFICNRWSQLMYLLHVLFATINMSCMVLIVKKKISIYSGRATNQLCSELEGYASFASLATPRFGTTWPAW